MFKFLKLRMYFLVYNLPCSFSRVNFVLIGQEMEDAPFREENFLFFMSGNDTGNCVYRLCSTLNFTKCDFL